MPRKLRLSLTTQIVIGMLVGVAVGFAVHHWDSSSEVKVQIIAWINIFSRIFLNLIKVIIAPLIFSTLVVGIAGAGGIRQIGRVALKAIIYFQVVTTLALLIGWGAASLIKPGVGVDLPSEASAEAKEIAARAAKLSPQDQIVNIFPQSVIAAASENNVLQIVIFSLIFAVALSVLGERGRPVIQFADALSQVMFKFTGYVMLLAPLGVGAAMAVTVGTKGLAVLQNLALLILSLYGALIVFIVVVLGSVALMIRLPIRRFVQLVR